jgi:hypothetical protein
MHWKQNFPSKYLQAADCTPPLDLTIASWKNENMGADGAGDLKPVIYFREIAKGCVLNITRGEAIASITGQDDIDHWIGCRVRLQQGFTRYQGKRVPCIEIVAPPSPAPRAKRTKPLAPPIESSVEGSESTDVADEVGF